MASSQNPYSHLREDEPTRDPGASDSEDDTPEANVPASSDDSTGALAFDDEGVGEALRHADEEALNAAPFGIIRIDDEGVVQFYNR
ncbi:MAG: hypothetical protein ABEK84_09605, partial [Salinibacter sp.]